MSKNYTLPYHRIGLVLAHAYIRVCVRERVLYILYINECVWMRNSRERKKV
jgi:hypothetical protein